MQNFINLLFVLFYLFLFVCVTYSSPSSSISTFRKLLTQLELLFELWMLSFISVDAHIVIVVVVVILNVFRCGRPSRLDSFHVLFWGKSDHTQIGEPILLLYCEMRVLDQAAYETPEHLLPCNVACNPCCVLESESHGAPLDYSVFAFSFNSSVISLPKWQEKILRRWTASWKKAEEHKALDRLLGNNLWWTVGERYLRWGMTFCMLCGCC